MTTLENGTDTLVDGQEPIPAGPERIPALGRGTPVVAILGIVVLSVVSWWLIGDPRWSIVGAKANGAHDAPRKYAIVSCVLFWVILAHIFTGFTFGNWPFSKLRQPLSGLLQVAADLVIGILCTILFVDGVGHWDPTFSTGAKDGAGYTAAAFIVLIGFYAYAFLPTSLGGYPFDAVAAPVASVAQWMLGAFLTVVGVVALVYPNFNTQLAPHAPVSLPTATGWVYSSIVIVIAGGMVLGNVPWAGIANRHLRGLAALAVTLGGGYLLMLIFEGYLHLLVPGYARHATGFAMAMETAQLGVCFAVCLLVTGLIAGPSKIASVALSRVVRILAVLVAATLTYLVFMRFFAVKVLHFPAVKGSYGGNPLLWIDWTILLVLWHAVAFGGHLTTRRAPAGRET